MNRKMERFFYFLPRILAVIIILFFAIFAIDAVKQGKTILENVGFFLLHLFPSYVLIAALLIAWKKEFYGGLLFLLAGAFFTYFYETYRYLIIFITISLPVFLTSLLFLLHMLLIWREKKKNESIM